MPNFRITSDGTLASLLRQRAFLIIALAVVSLCSACSGTGSSRGLSDRGIYSVRLGVASLSAINREARPIFSRYGYTVERRDVYGNDQLRLRTEWKTRSVFDDEEIAGYVQAQTRLFLLTRPSTGLSGTRVSLRSETRYQRDEGGDWKSAAITEEAKRRIDEIAREFRDIFQVEGLN